MINSINRQVVLTGLALLFFIGAKAQDVTLAGPGACNGAAVSGTWTVPCDVTSITIEIYGGGGGGGGRGGGSNGGFYDSRGGGGGGGGGYSTITINVTPGSSFNYTIGAGGCGGDEGSDGNDGDNGTNGTASTFSGTSLGGTPVTLNANGGARGIGGDGSEGSAGPGGAGGTGSGGSTNTTGTAGSNGNSDNGGNGGAGGGPGGGGGGVGNGAAGTAYGGGGAGGGDPGGRGGAGGILITYTVITPIAAPVISSTPATCTVAGTSTITNYDPAQTYTFTPMGPSPAISGLINGMAPGTSYTVTVGTGSCISPPSAPFSNAAGSPPAAPTVSTAAPTCSANGISTITNYNASLTYVFTPVGPSAGAGGVISGMTPGTNYTVLADDGNCTSASSASFSIAAQLASPAVPTITTIPPTCLANGSSTISNYNAALTYTFTPVGPAAGGGGAITGMVTGTSYTVLANNGSCPSSSSAAFSNGASGGPPAVPTVSTLPASCSADGISAITNYNALLTYVFSPVGPSAGGGGVISGMTPGTSYTVLADDGSCTSAASTSFSNGAQLVTPAVPTITTTPPSCVADGSSVISNYNAALTYTFTPAGPSAGGGGAIGGMVTGTSYTVESSNGTCPSGSSASFSNGALTAPPAVPIVSTAPPTCSADGISTITNYNAALTYIFTPGGPSDGAGGVISGMTPGTSYTVDASDGSCNSGASASFSISAQLTVPVAAISGSLTYCTGGNTTLTASGGTGYTWTDAGGANIGNAASVTVTQGTYTVEVINAGGCMATATATVTESTNLTVTIAGTLTYCEGGSTTLTASGGTSYSWSDGSTAASITVSQEGTYSVTATTGGCSGTASEDVTELAVTPVDFGSTLTACADSLLIIDAGSGYATYAWDNGETTQIITPQSSGAFSVTVTDANGCTVSASVSVVFNECVEDSFTIYIPNAFSPNSDRDNDVFRVTGTNIADLNLRIFNRWGEQIHVANGITGSWDGTYKLGEVEQGVYTYLVEISLQSGTRQSYRGIVTVVR